MLRLICDREINTGTTEKEKNQPKQCVRSLIAKISVTPSELRRRISTLPIT